ncbi:MAG: hypothetical protein KAU46_03650 [Candidatus Aminicenantes bacterium]|nr:hypothetical protein [Candidatus Aminicenantes bacterium]
MKMNISSVDYQNLTGLGNYFFYPLDFTCIVRRFFNALEPKLFVLAESEFWPFPSGHASSVFAFPVFLLIDFLD